MKNRPALPWLELPDFMAQLVEREGAAVHAVRFAILTACRSGELRGAAWSEIGLWGGATSQCMGFDRPFAIGAQRRRVTQALEYSSAEFDKAAIGKPTAHQFGEKGAGFSRRR